MIWMIGDSTLHHRLATATTFSKFYQKTLLLRDEFIQIPRVFNGIAIEFKKVAIAVKNIGGSLKYILLQCSMYTLQYIINFGPKFRWASEKRIKNEAGFLLLSRLSNKKKENKQKQERTKIETKLMSGFRQDRQDKAESIHWSARRCVELNQLCGEKIKALSVTSLKSGGLDLLPLKEKQFKTYNF